MLNVCDKVNLLRVGVYFRCVVLCRTSQFAKKFNIFFLFSNYIPRESKIFFEVNSELAQVLKLTCLVQTHSVASILW